MDCSMWIMGNAEGSINGVYLQMCIRLIWLLLHHMPMYYNLQIHKIYLFILDELVFVACVLIHIYNGKSRRFFKLDRNFIANNRWPSEESLSRVPRCIYRTISGVIIVDVKCQTRISSWHTSIQVITVLIPGNRTYTMHADVFFFITLRVFSCEHHGILSTLPSVYFSFIFARGQWQELLLQNQ